MKIDELWGYDCLVIEMRIIFTLLLKESFHLSVIVDWK